MQIINTARELHKLMESEKQQKKSIGFVPTMGALHEGHISLINASVVENDITVASIFVNPTQFGPDEDLDKYPRTLEQDKDLLEQAGCDYLYCPDVEDVYGPEGSDKTLVIVQDLTQHLCGLSRPGHFEGVTTVVAKLFNSVRPHRAYFGQKDYQQSVILRHMNEDLKFFIDIRVMPIVRDQDGLALSSRNKYLDPSHRKQALILYRSLELTKKTYTQYMKNVPGLISMLKAYIKNEAPQVRIDYINMLDADTLEDVITIEKDVVLALAVYVGQTRLIDNCIIKISV